jgi:hypothetical protein
MTPPRVLALAAVLGFLPLVPAPAQQPDQYDQSGVPIEELPTDPKLAKVVLIAGNATPTVKVGEHEYFAGMALMMKMLKQTPGVAPVLARDGWPKKPETLAGAKAVVIFAEGGKVHPALQGDRLTQLQKLADAGVGVAHLHSAIDYPKDLGERVKGFSGAVFEPGYSQRAHWVTTFDKFPDHPTCRGVTPFTIDDGWLYKLRFVPEMKGVTPLLRTLPPKSPVGKFTDDDGIVGWAYDRPGGGRSFAFTGCHIHASFGMDGFRRFITNGILWAARQDIPAGGAPVALDPADLKRNFDKRPAKK